MDITNVQPVIFDGDYYTLPDAIELICEKFGIPLNTIKVKNKKGTIEYKTIYQRLRRELESMHLTEPDIKKMPGKRKTQYSGAVLSHVVNVKLYPFFFKKAELINDEEYKQLEKERKKSRQAYADYIAGVQPEDVVPLETDRSLDKTFLEYKLEIALEYIFDKCIKLNEQLLRDDIALMLMADESDPILIERAAIERLKDYKNYYTDKQETT